MKVRSDILLKKIVVFVGFLFQLFKLIALQGRSQLFFSLKSELGDQNASAHLLFTKKKCHLHVNTRETLTANKIENKHTLS